MTRRPTPRQLERALDRAEEETVRSDPYEIVITDHVVETDHPVEVNEPVRKTRVWRDERGEWHSEEIDVDEERDCDSNA